MKSSLFLRSAALVFCVSVVAGHACAHAFPKNETPASGAVGAAPHDVSIIFDDALEPAFSTLTVSDAQGKPVTAVKAVFDATHRNMRLPMPALVMGRYEAKWVAVAVDGHRTTGHYQFSVR